MKKSHEKRLNKQLGEVGEGQAAQFLEQKGFSIVARNYRFKRAEIDLIVRQEKLLVFVEVKLRKNHHFGEPESFVTEAQARRIVTAAEQFIFEQNWQHDIRFDIIAITQSTQEIEHLEDAFH